jgi:hypothetical protein
MRERLFVMIKPLVQPILPAVDPLGEAEVGQVHTLFIGRVDLVCDVQ